MSNFHTLPVLAFGISDDDEGHHEADNNRDFDDTVKLLEKLRTENPTVLYIMYAEIDA